MNKKRIFNKILKDIKEIKIQGARNIAKSALEAYNLIPTKNSKNKLLNSRPTEPMMQNVLEMAQKKVPKEKILNHFDSAQEQINKNCLKLIKKNKIIFRHCH